MNGGEVEFVRLTGQPRAMRGSDELDFLPDKRFHLLTYLAYNSGWVGRERAAFLFWPDADTEGSRRNLRGLLQRLRTLPFEPGIEANKHQLRWDVPTDVKVFNEAVEQGDVDRAIDSYQGPLLEGLESDDSGEFGEWLEIAREELRSRWRAVALERLAATEPGDEKSADGLIRRLLDADPLDEEAVRSYLTVMARLEKPTAGRGVYREFAGRLERELGLEPTSETVAAFEALEQLGPVSKSFRQSTRSSPEPDAAVVKPGSGKASRAASRLPVPTTRFFGRERELAEIVDRLRDPDCRLLSLVGQGGVGKTRLALKAARSLVEEPRSSIADGVVFVPLDVTRSASEVVPAIADALGIVPASSSDLFLQVTACLAESQRLLLLDNFEHVLEAAKFVTRLIAEAPGLKVLVTTRERLSLETEWTYELTGLDYPEFPSSLDKLSTCGAVRLLVDRAQRVRPGFQLDVSDIAALESLLALTEGLPLAIELTAAWLRAVPLSNLVDDIRGNSDLLVSTRLDSTPRHASIRAVFEQSWAQLTEPGREVLRKMAVFSAPIRPEAAVYVTGASTATIASLVDKSLLRLDRNGRYDRHPLLYSFTREKLAEEPAQQDAVEKRHASYYLRFLRERTDRARGQHPATVMNEIADEMPEVKGALRRAMANGNASELVDLLELLELHVGYFRAKGYSDDALELLSAGARAALQLGRLEAARDLRGRLGDAFGIHRGDAESALREYRAAAELAAQAGDAAREAVFVSLCGVMLAGRDGAAGWAELDKALVLARSASDGPALSTVLEHRAYMLGQSEDFVAARQFYDESLAVIEASLENEPIDSYELARRRFYAILNLGDMDRRLGEVEKALAAKGEALQMAMEMSSPILQAHAHFGLGEMFSDLERRQEAQRHLELAATTYLENNVTAQLDRVRAVASRYGYELSAGTGVERSR